MFSNLDVDPRFRRALTAATNFSIAENTKNQYVTASKHITRCVEFTGQEMSFPFDTKKTLNYVGFLIEVRKVQSKTISQYLSAIRYLHLVEGHDPSCLRPPIVALILRGREHWDEVEKKLENKPKRVAVTVEIMKFIKRSLVRMHIGEEEKLRVWAVCALMMCASLRVHEVLSKGQDHCPQTTLMYEDFEMSEVRVGGTVRTIIRLRLKSPKEDRVGSGLWLEIFGNNTMLCPVRAVKKWLSVAIKPQVGQPFFRLKSGDNFTGKDLNKILSKITASISDSMGGVVRAHSFRSAIPTQMGLMGFSNEDIQAQGRWTSGAFKAYIKKDRLRRLQFTDKWVERMVADKM